MLLICIDLKLTELEINKFLEKNLETVSHLFLKARKCNESEKLKKQEKKTGQTKGIDAGGGCTDRVQKKCWSRRLRALRNPRD